VRGSFRQRRTRLWRAQQRTLKKTDKAKRKGAAFLSPFLKASEKKGVRQSPQSFVSRSETPGEYGAEGPDKAFK